MRRATTFALAVPLLSLALYSGACSSDDDDHHGSSVDLADVVYEPHAPGDPHEPVNGGPTDEALDAIVEAAPVEDATRAASFSSPASGAMLPADPPATFTWQTGAAPGSDGGLGLRAAPPPAVPGLRALLGPERAAFAHNAPYNGTAYLVVFKSAADDTLVRVFTSSTSYTPDAETWAKLKGANGPISASVLTGRFTNNAIDSDGGPFQGPPVTFSIRE
jgi:hypothetical protein